eukprot:4630458-Amphidinium_carterae.1
MGSDAPLPTLAQNSHGIAAQARAWTVTALAAYPDLAPLHLPNHALGEGSRGSAHHPKQSDLAKGRTWNGRHGHMRMAIFRSCQAL